MSISKNMKTKSRRAANAVHDVVLVAVSHAFEQHKHVRFDLSLGDWRGRVANDLGKVRKHVLKCKHEAGCMGKHLPQKNDVVMALHYLKGLDFAQGSVGDALLRSPKHYLLERHNVAWAGSTERSSR